MDKNKREKENNIPPKIFSLESPIQSQYIKSSIFQNNDNSNNININKNNFNKNTSFKNKFHRRSLTQHHGIFHLNQIGYIKNDNNYENKKNEENKNNNKINSSQNINNLVNKILSSHNNKYNFESCNKRNKKNGDLDFKEKNCTEDKFIKARRKYTEYYKKVKKFNVSKKYCLKESKYSRYESAKNIEVNNFEAKKSKQNKSSLSFRDVDEENNEEDSNENNNDSSYISKIESKHVSMYDIDEELKELKEIGNNLKSPVYRPNNRNYNRLISSFSINNNDNDNENENNDNFKQKSILLQLKKMVSKNDNENKVNHNPIVFGDNLELSFHEDQNKKSTKIQNSLSLKIINYINDKYKIKKWLNFKNYNIYISQIDTIKNKKFCFYYKNDCNFIKKNSIELTVNIGQIDNIRKRKYNINDFSIDNIDNYNNRRNVKKEIIHNEIGKNINKNIKIENKSNKKKLILRNKKESYNKINNQYKNIIKKENISLKNNYRIQNTNELNKLIKEKINFLSMKNRPNTQQVYQTITTNKNREEKKINLTFINTLLNSHKELSFNNNDLLMIRENDIFCYGGEETNKNNITYNRFYNGNNITMNNFYNNYKLNDSNNNICYNTEINNEREFLNGKNINIINAIKNKLALKLKEEIYKNQKNNFKNNKIEKNKDYKNPNDNYYKYSNQEDLNIKKYLIKNKKDKLNGLNNDYKDIFIDKYLSKCSSEIINQKNINNYNCSDNFNNIYSESNLNSIFLKLNPIVEQKYFEKKINKSISINKKNNKKQNISSERHLLNRKNYNINKKKNVSNNKNNRNKLILNNPINIINLNEKKVNNKSDKKFNSKKKNFAKSIHSHKRNNFSPKKNYITINSHNNSISKNKKHNGNNKSVENKTKKCNINECSSGEIINYKFNKINPNYDSNKINFTKNKLADLRNNRLKKEKPSNIITKNIINTRMNIDLNDNNPSVRHIESGYKIQNKDNTKNKINLNRTDAKKSIAIKGKINGK